MTLAVGLMSGTSIDGIDAALVAITGRPSELQIKLLDWAIYPFPPRMREKILSVSHPNQGKGAEICRLNFELGELFAKSALRLCRRAKVPLSKIEVIGSHGQTICHLGREGTLQIGEPSVIAERTGVTTVADFRPRDVAAGGFGAPLAPYLHCLLFQDPKKTKAVHNIGGISNLTYLPKKRKGGEKGSLGGVIGFDTGPGNMVIDGLMNELKGMPHDDGGRVASRGRVSLRLLRELMQHPFILKKPPKTAGREEFGRPFVQKIIRRGLTLGLRREDLIATATAFTASSIAENYRRFIFPKGLPDEIVFGGGGTHNLFLMRMIQTELPIVQISLFDHYGIPADAAEAVCFAVLAFEMLQGRETNVPSVTGAERSVLLGKIVPGRKR